MAILKPQYKCEEVPLILNLIAYFFCCPLFLRYLNRSNKIVNIVSVTTFVHRDYHQGCIQSLNS